MALKPPGRFSTAADSLVRTPYRLSSWLAKAWLHSVAEARDEGTRLQRPCALGGVVRRERKEGRLCWRLGWREVAGRATYARKAWKVSLVTRPRQTRFHSASSVSPGYPPPTASCNWAKKAAPLRPNCSNNKSSRGLNGLSAGGSVRGGSRVLSLSARNKAI